MVKYCNSLG